VEMLRRRRARELLYGLDLQLDISRGLYRREAAMARTRIVLRPWERRLGKGRSRNRCKTPDRSTGERARRLHARGPLNESDLQLGILGDLYRMEVEVNRMHIVPGS
jgi:hypothetical protein